MNDVHIPHLSLFRVLQAAIAQLNHMEPGGFMRRQLADDIRQVHIMMMELERAAVAARKAGLQ